MVDCGAADCGGVAGCSAGGGAGGSGGTGVSLAEINSISKIRSLFRRDHRRPAALSIGELVGNEEAALSANMHSGKAAVPSGNYAVRALLKGKRLVSIER